MTDDEVIDMLMHYHRFGLLTDEIVDTMTIETELDCTELCKTNGITYEICSR